MASFSNYSQNQTSITFGEFLVTPIEIATIKTKLRNETISEPVNIFLIQTKGKNILIDAGIDSSWNSYKKSHLKTALFFKNFNISNKININDALRQLGLTVDSIHFLILTHSHFDHIYGLSTFKNAQIIMSKKEATAFKWGLLNGYLKINKKCIKKANKIVFVADSALKSSFLKSYIFMPNFKIVPTYGHTKGHISVLLTNKSESLLFTGDCSFRNKLNIHFYVLRFEQTHNVRLLFNHISTSK
jgi:glyoxylase-like metal-dependent hydrolase (beta-lactamase superfamily II)